VEKESDVTIISDSQNAIQQAKKAFYNHRASLEAFTLHNELFLNSLYPLQIKSSIKVIDLMINAASKCNVGPMAAVAGALADLMLEAMMIAKKKPRIALVENGGEVAINSEKDIKIALYAGNNPLNLNIGFLISKQDCPIGIATSSATIGHAISLGLADAVTIFADNATIADAAATRIANLVKGIDVERSIRDALDQVPSIDGVRGAFISREDKVGQVGTLPKIFKIDAKRESLLLDKNSLGNYNGN
jgi:ApbE superfamily uncharacterized protein (UPF0280 family)